MRKKLKSLNGERLRFSAVVERFGIKSGWRGDQRTILLRNICHEGVEITDHLWFTIGKTIDALALKSGQRVQFDARASRYTKGYRGHREEIFDSAVEVDYRLDRPTKWIIS